MAILLPDYSEARAIFQRVQADPYKLPLRYHDPHDFDDLDHCCFGKTEWLMREYRKLGIPVRPIFCEFNWSSIALPNWVEKIPHELDCGHVLPQAKLEVLVYSMTEGICRPVTKWCNVDPTWDLELELLGLEGILPMSTWEEVMRGGTPVGVKYTRMYGPEASLKYYTEETPPEETEKDLKKNGKFYSAFNKWLEIVRVLNKSREAQVHSTGKSPSCLALA